MADIFISYSRKDSNIVGAFVWRLEHEGFKVWIDRDGIYSGNVFAEVIATAIEESKVLIFFSSENSNISPWTAGEIGIANMYGKHIIPVRLDHSPYNKRVIIHLVNLDYIDYSDPSKHYVMMEKLVKELRELCPDTAPRESHISQDIELYLEEQNGAYGFTDKTGKTIIPFLYEEAGRFRHGLSRVCLSGKWGYIDKTGQAIVELKYNYVEEFNEDLAMVVLNGRFGFVDTSGNEVIPPTYSNANSFSEGVAVVEMDGLYFFINKNNTLAFPARYLEADDFSEGLAAVSNNGKWGFINHSGELVIPMIYDEVNKFRNGHAHVLQNGKWIDLPAPK